MAGILTLSNACARVCVCVCVCVISVYFYLVKYALIFAVSQTQYHAANSLEIP